MPGTNLSQEDLNILENRIVTRLLKVLSEPETAEKLSAAWGKHIDQMLGKGLRRVGGVVVVFLLGVAAIKFDLIAQMFKGH